MALLVKVLPWVQIGLSVLLVTAILLQRSGADTGGALGGSGDMSSLYHTKRGLEKVLFNATILIALLFAASAFVALVVK